MIEYGSESEKNITNSFRMLARIDYVNEDMTEILVEDLLCLSDNVSELDRDYMLNQYEIIYNNYGNISINEYMMIYPEIFI